MITEVVSRNSGAMLRPCVYKTGKNMTAQGGKMQLAPAVFAPVLALTPAGYVMPVLAQATDTDMAKALDRLTWLWRSPNVGLATQERALHHQTQVASLSRPELRVALAAWWGRAQGRAGTAVNNVHGDATLENVMESGLWIDPSVRPMPLEAEFDGGKLLQSYFGYGEGCNAQRRALVLEFLQKEHLDLELTAYYLMTHIVRLYVVQPQARAWALDLAENLEERMESLLCCK